MASGSAASDQGDDRLFKRLGLECAVQDGTHLAQYARCSDQHGDDAGDRRGAPDVGSFDRSGSF
jgi:hypothetical protein